MKRYNVGDFYQKANLLSKIIYLFVTILTGMLQCTILMGMLQCTILMGMLQCTILMGMLHCTCCTAQSAHILLPNLSISQESTEYIVAPMLLYSTLYTDANLVSGEYETTIILTYSHTFGNGVNEV